MAYRNKIIENPKTGQSIKFLLTSKDTSGKLLEMETSFSGHSKEPPPHFHPFQEEDFVILSGELTVRIEGHVQNLKVGDTLHVPANRIHSMWNSSNGVTLVNWKVKPALDTEHLLEIVSGLARDRETNGDGLPNFFQLVLLARRYSNVFRSARPPYYIQKVLFGMFSPLSYALGYRSTYKKYLD